MTTWLVYSGGDGTNPDNATGNKTTAAVSISSLVAAQTVSANDVIFVHKTHNALIGGALNWSTTGLPETAGPLAIYTVDMDSSNAMVADSTATEDTNSAANITIKSSDSETSVLRVFGLTFKAGSNNSSVAGISLQGGVRGVLELHDCTFVLNNSSPSSTIAVGSTATASINCVEFHNCKFKFGHSTQKITCGGGLVKFYNCSVLSSGSRPTALFSSQANSCKGTIECIGCDWTFTSTLVDVAAGGTANWGPLQYKFRHCATYTTTHTTGTHPGPSNLSVETFACGPVDAANGPDILQYFLSDGRGTVAADRTVYLAASSSEGTQSDGVATPYSIKFSPSSAVSALLPQRGPWIAKKVTGTGSRNITVKFADTETGLLKNSQLGIEVCYVGGNYLADSPQMQFEGSAPVVSGTIYRDASAAGSSLTDTNEAWHDDGGSGGNLGGGTSGTHTYTITKTVTISQQGQILVRGVLYSSTTNPVYMDGTVTVSTGA